MPRTAKDRVPSRRRKKATELDRFEELAKALVKVPKKEIDAQREREKPSPNGS